MTCADARGGDGVNTAIDPLDSAIRMPVCRLSGMPLNSGEEFAGYLIQRLLGTGGMGEVYLAQHPRLPRHDALKILSADISADADYRERFLREADLAAA